MCVVQLVVKIVLSCGGLRGDLHPQLHVQTEGLYLPSARISLPLGTAQTHAEHIQALISGGSRLLAALQAKRLRWHAGMLQIYGSGNAQQSSIAVFSMVANKMNKQQSLCASPPHRQ